MNARSLISASNAAAALLSLIMKKRGERASYICSIISITITIIIVIRMISIMCLLMLISCDIFVNNTLGEWDRLWR